MDIPVILLLMLLCLLFEAFFSGAEIGVISADHIELRHDAAKGNRGARLALEMLEKPEWLLSTTLVGTNIAIITNTSLATLLAIKLLGVEFAWAAIAVAAPLIWIFGEIVPKSVFQQKANVLTPRIIFILKGASILFFPLLVIFTAITRLLTRFAGARSESGATLRKEIELMLQMPASEGDVQAVEKTMIRRMFNFSETRVRDIAIPLIDVAAIPHTATCGQARQKAAELSHARLPVFRNRVDQIIGTIHIRQCIRQPLDQPIQPLIEPARYIPGAMSIERLLEEFRETHARMAIMVDEYGAAEGIITLEDIMERIVGEIEDEYDRAEASPESWVRQVGERRFLVNPRVDLIALKEEWGFHIPDGPYETLGGFLMELAGDVPQTGQELRFREMVFTIGKADEKSLREVWLEFSSPE